MTVIARPACDRKSINNLQAIHPNLKKFLVVKDIEVGEVLRGTVIAVSLQYKQVMPI